jgi:threonine dehydrogenase-like Zn-dependent dehydrogenase
MTEGKKGGTSSEWRMEENTMRNSRSAVLALLSDPSPPAVTPVLLDTAVVLGAGIAGLLAARVLSHHASTVIIMRPGPGQRRRRYPDDHRARHRTGN